MLESADGGDDQASGVQAVGGGTVEVLGPDAAAPVAIGGDSAVDGFVAVSKGVSHGCGLRASGRVECWGDSFVGRAASPTGTFTAISAGLFATCGIRLSGLLSCWDTGVLRWGFPSPGVPWPTDTFKALSLGSDLCAIRTDDTLVCWGRFVPPPGEFVDVSVGDDHACGIHVGGRLACWGDETAELSRPPPGVFSAVDSGRGYACAVTTSETVRCWGDNLPGYHT